MRSWIFLDHPTKSRCIVPTGFSWVFFFFGSIWAIATTTWSALAYQALIWGAYIALRTMALFSPEPQRSALDLLSYAVGIIMNVVVSSWANGLRLQSLLDRGYRETMRMEGPTREFVEAELARGAAAPSKAESPAKPASANQESGWSARN